MFGCAAEKRGNGVRLEGSIMEASEGRFRNKRNRE
jgi:hypothetical protein